MSGFLSMLFGDRHNVGEEKPIYDACRDDCSLAMALVSYLCGIPVRDVKWDATYMTNVLGAMCFVTPKYEGTGIVEITGCYVRISDWQFEDIIVQHCPCYSPIVQVDCSAFDDLVSYVEDWHEQKGILITQGFCL